MPQTSVALSGAGTVTIPAVTGKQIRLVALFGAATGAGTLQLKSHESATALTGAMNLAASGTPAVVLPYNPEGWAESVVSEGLDIIAATAGFNGVAVWMKTGS